MISVYPLFSLTTIHGLLVQFHDRLMVAKYLDVLSGKGIEPVP